MLDQNLTTAPAARRAFRSKVDSIRPTYGFDDVSLAPGTETVEPDDVVVAQEFCGIELAIPVLAAAMDAVVDARSAGVLAGLGGLGFLNLEGVQARYEDPGPVLERIASAADAEIQAVLSEAYAAPIRDELIARRIAEIHAAGSKAAAAATPGAARRFGPRISALAPGGFGHYAVSRIWRRESHSRPVGLCVAEACESFVASQRQ